MTYHLYMCVGGGQAGDLEKEGGGGQRFIQCDEDGVWRTGADGEKRGYTRTSLSHREKKAKKGPVKVMQRAY